MEAILTLIREALANFNVYLGYLATAITLFSFVVALVNAIKEKKFAKIKELALEFIAQAEEFKCKNGQSVDGTVKKEIVLGKIKTACGNFGVKYNEKFWSATVDSLVEFSKNVNKRV